MNYIKVILISLVLTCSAGSSLAFPKFELDHIGAKVHVLDRIVDPAHRPKDVQVLDRIIDPAHRPKDVHVLDRIVDPALCLRMSMCWIEMSIQLPARMASL